MPTTHLFAYLYIPICDLIKYIIYQYSRLTVIAFKEVSLYIRCARPMLSVLHVYATLILVPYDVLPILFLWEM